MTPEPLADAMNWNDAYLLGYGPMDATHREFVETVRALQLAPDPGLLPALEAARAHCESHFGQERQWMEETEMPGRDCHVDEHAAVLSSMNEVARLLSETPGERSCAIARSLAAELARWFPGHADHMDSALSHWMSKKRFGGKPLVIRRNIVTNPPGTD